MSPYKFIHKPAGPSTFAGSGLPSSSTDITAEAPAGESAREREPGESEMVGVQSSTAENMYVQFLIKDGLGPGLQGTLPGGADARTGAPLDSVSADIEEEGGYSASWPDESTLRTSLPDTKVHVLEIEPHAQDRTSWSESDLLQHKDLAASGKAQRLQQWCLHDDSEQQLRTTRDLFHRHLTAFSQETQKLMDAKGAVPDQTLDGRLFYACAWLGTCPLPDDWHKLRQNAFDKFFGPWKGDQVEHGMPHATQPQAGTTKHAVWRCLFAGREIGLDATSFLPPSRRDMAPIVLAQYASKESPPPRLPAARRMLRFLDALNCTLLNKTVVQTRRLAQMALDPSALPLHRTGPQLKFAAQELQLVMAGLRGYHEAWTEMSRKNLTQETLIGQHDSRWNEAAHEQVKAVLCERAASARTLLDELSMMHHSLRTTLAQSCVAPDVGIDWGADHASRLRQASSLIFPERAFRSMMNLMSHAVVIANMVLEQTIEMSLPQKREHLQSSLQEIRRVHADMRRILGQASQCCASVSDFDKPHDPTQKTLEFLGWIKERLRAQELHQLVELMPDLQEHLRQEMVMVSKWEQDASEIIEDALKNLAPPISVQPTSLKVPEPSASARAREKQEKLQRHLESQMARHSTASADGDGKGAKRRTIVPTLDVDEYMKNRFASPSSLGQGSSSSSSSSTLVGSTSSGTRIGDLLAELRSEPLDTVGDAKALFAKWGFSFSTKEMDGRHMKFRKDGVKTFELVASNIDSYKLDGLTHPRVAKDILDFLEAHGRDLASRPPGL